MTGAGRLHGRFAAKVLGPLCADLPADPLNKGDGAIAAGAWLEGAFSIADCGYLHGEAGTDAVFGYSDGVAGLIGITFRFARVDYTQSDAAFQEIRYTSSAADGVYDGVSFNANDVFQAGESTQAIFTVALAAEVRGTSLATLVAMPFSGGGRIYFSEWRDHQRIGGFAALLESLNTWSVA